MEETRIIDYDDTYEGQSQALPSGAELLDGKFKVDEQIGAGGFGITYLARDIYLDRNVVIKECFAEALCFRFGEQVKVGSPRYEAQHRKSVEMFMLEARSIAKLRHPNIVGVHQVFEENETAYMVLDLIHGRDLQDILEDEEATLSPDQIRDILVKTLDAIDLIHRNDLLHRDISPDNILLDKWGSPTLIDFGAAREDASKKTNDATHMLVVKDGYSPHEFYIVGGQQTPCSDLYALGATIYHLITGQAPPNSQTRVAALTNNEGDPYVPLAGQHPAFEDAFLKAIDQALKVPPKERIASATDWLALIEADSKKVKIVNIPETTTISKSLCELVFETNKHVFTAPSKPVQQETPSRVVPREATYRPEWADEFNQETTEAEQRRRNEERTSPEASDLQGVEYAHELEDVDTAEQRGKPRNLLDWVSPRRSA